MSFAWALQVTVFVQLCLAAAVIIPINPIIAELLGVPIVRDGGLEAIGNFVPIRRIDGVLEDGELDDGVRVDLGRAERWAEREVDGEAIGDDPDAVERRV